MLCVNKDINKRNKLESPKTDPNLFEKLHR